MAEPRKNHVSIDGGQVKEDENVASYKPIPDSDTEFRSAKPTLSKSKERVSDEAEEKLLDKEEEAKIVTRVDMADAKYVVGDHRNGDAKIELDANKRQFSGLTKEELLKYAEDPFWVRLRWFMFALFWALWLCMLAGAVAIIVRAPKCSPPPPKAWFEKGPLVDMSSVDSYELIEEELPALKAADVKGVFTQFAPTYDVLDNPDLLTRFKQFVDKAKEYGVKVIVDLTPNYVSTDHTWFQLSVNRTAPYDKYFTWESERGYDENKRPIPRNNWVSTTNTSAWEWNAERGQFYLHQYGAEQPDLNFHEPSVVAEFDKVLRMWMKAGADGVRLHKVRELVVNASREDETAASGKGSAPAADHTTYEFWRHRLTSDQPLLDSLLARWAALVDSAVGSAGETVFTVAEERRPELFLLGRNLSCLRPPSAAPVSVTTASDLVAVLKDRLPSEPAIQLVSGFDDEEHAEGLAEFALLLPATPVLDAAQLVADSNDTSPSERLSHLVALREDASVEHGRYLVAGVPDLDSGDVLVACARWKAGHTGYLALHNPSAETARANATLPAASVPAALTVHHVGRRGRLLTNYTSNYAVSRDSVIVPARSTVVLSYVPATTAEQ